MVLSELTGTINLRTQAFDGIVKGFAAATYKFKQAVSIVSTSAWTNYFWRESPDALVAASGSSGIIHDVKHIPRGAPFPTASVTFERIKSTIEKYGFEEEIQYEDLISDDVDVRDRTLFRIAERVTKSVDDEIWDKLSEDRVSVDIQNINLAVGTYWNGASAAIINDLLYAKQLIAEKNYPIGNLMCYLSPKDHRYVMKWLSDKGAQFPTLGTETAKNGNVGTLAGIQLVVSNSVTASYALVVVPKRCGTWKEMQPLRTITKEDPMKSLLIRTAEFGTTQITDPKAIVLIRNTQGIGA